MRVALIGISLSLTLLGCGASDPEAQRLSEFDYALAESWPECEPGVKAGIAGRIDKQKSPNGIQFSVRTPANYLRQVQHPLIVVYAAGGQNRKEAERFIGITRAATARGFIVAYADNPPLTVDSIVDLSHIPALVGESWCIDSERVFLTGHSNGGLISNAIAFLEQSQHVPTAIAPSAAGISGSDFAEQQCPAKPLSVFVMHSANDRAFRGNGKAAAQWWAGCNRCNAESVPADAEGCVVFEQCTNGIVVRYCEGSARHGKWPGLNAEILQFFVATKTRTDAPPAE